MKHSDLYDSLLRCRYLESGMIVGSNLIKEMEIYGFIPYLENDKSVLQILDNHNFLNMNFVSIAADRAVFPIDRRSSISRILGQTDGYVVHPIMRKIGCCDSDIMFPLDDIYILSMWHNSYYQKFRNKQLHQLNYSKLASLSHQIEINKDGVFYRTLSNDFLMYKKKTYPFEKVSGIASYFLVVCRYINSVTGAVTYSIFLPEDLVLLTEK